MPAYVPYPKKKDTPSRNLRKSQRCKVFSLNTAAGRLLRKARKAKLEAIAEARAEREQVVIE